MYTSPLAPLAERMRPKNIDEYIGQKHLLAPDAILYKMLINNNISSFILWGPAGVGKTSLARIIAEKLDRDFYTLSAISSGVKELRDIISEIENKRKSIFGQGSKSPILFIDEIHRFSKSQQDSLLSIVEDGTITLIAATTENPSYEIIKPLLSRCQVYTLKALSNDDLLELFKRSIEKDEILHNKAIKLRESQTILNYANGDARKFLNILELIIQSNWDKEEIIIDNLLVKNCIQENILTYDKKSDTHYDTISAFIKSIRGSDPNAAIYYLARMLNAGEDVKFIARRLCISASEDIGLANPNALLIANACFDIVEKIGMPEARIPLAEATIYLASSVKSNSAYLAINEALDFVKNSPNHPIPLDLRNANTPLMSSLDYGKNYKYSHNYENHFINQEFMPQELSSKSFYKASNNRIENGLKEYLKDCWKDKYDF